MTKVSSSFRVTELPGQHILRISEINRSRSSSILNQKAQKDNCQGAVDNSTPVPSSRCVTNPTMLFRCLGSEEPIRETDDYFTTATTSSLSFTVSSYWVRASHSMVGLTPEKISKLNGRVVEFRRAIRLVPRDRIDQTAAYRYLDKDEWTTPSFDQLITPTGNSSPIETWVHLHQDQTLGNTAYVRPLSSTGMATSEPVHTGYTPETAKPIEAALNSGQPTPRAQAAIDKAKAQDKVIQGNAKLPTDMPSAKEIDAENKIVAEIIAKDDPRAGMDFFKAATDPGDPMQARVIGYERDYICKQSYIDETERKHAEWVKANFKPEVPPLLVDIQDIDGDGL